MDERLERVPIELLAEDQHIRSNLNQEVVEQIAKSFRAIGQLQPIRVRRVGDGFKIVDGHHRVAAAKRAGLADIIAIVERQEFVAGEVIQRQLIANCQRAGVPPVDAARGIQALMAETGWNAGQAAAAIGFSNAKATRLLALLSLPPETIDQIASGRIPASSAYELTKVMDPAKQAELARQMLEGGLTRDGAARARKSADRTKAARKGATTRVTVLLGTGRSVTVAGAGLTLDTVISAVEELLAKARRERTRGTELTTFVRLLKDQARSHS